MVIVMKIFLTLILSFSLLFPSFSIASNDHKKITTPTASSVVADSAASEAEIKYLKLQIALMKENDNALLNTIYWTLGTVATVTVLLVGFGWLSNFKFHDSEKQRIKDELDSKINEAMSKINSKASLDRLELNKDIDIRIEKQTETIEKNIEIVRVDLIERLARIAESLPIIESKIKESSVKIAAAENRSHWIETNIRIIEENIWDLKNVPANILITQFQGLQSAIACNSDFYIKSILESMINTVDEKFIKAELPFPKDMLSHIKNEVQNAVQKCPIEASRALDSLSKIKVRNDD